MALLSSFSFSFSSFCFFHFSCCPFCSLSDCLITLSSALSASRTLTLTPLTHFRTLSLFFSHSLAHVLPVADTHTHTLEPPHHPPTHPVTHYSHPIRSIHCFTLSHSVSLSHSLRKRSTGSRQQVWRRKDAPHRHARTVAVERDAKSRTGAPEGRWRGERRGHTQKESEISGAQKST